MTRRKKPAADTIKETAERHRLHHLILYSPQIVHKIGI